jgi:hypothetical protein
LAGYALSGSIDHGQRERILGEKEMGMQEDRRESEPSLHVALLGGRLSCVVGLLLGIVEFLAALYGGGANISAGALGVGLCVLGYFLGSRRLATATVVLCAAAMIFGLAASQGRIPGIAPSDHALPSIFWAKENAS